MDRYTRVLKPRDETPMNENEIRITAQGRIRNYISYATTLLEEKDYNEIVIKAMGRAINKTIMIVELIKRRIEGLHQNTSIESADITDVWEPLEEGLLPLETIRHVSMITVTLSKKELDTSSPGYQPPIPADQVKPLTNFDYGGEFVPSSRGRGRGRGRGRSRGMMMNGAAGYDADGNWEGGRGGYGGGRGSGYGYGGRRGRGGRGRWRGPYGGGGRGGEGNYYDTSGDMEAEEHEEQSGAYDGAETDVPPPQGRGAYDGAETDVPPPQGRGRGRGGRGRGHGGGGRGRGRA